MFTNALFCFCVCCTCVLTTHLCLHSMSRTFFCSSMVSSMNLVSSPKSLPQVNSNKKLVERAGPSRDEPLAADRHPAGCCCCCCCCNNSSSSSSRQGFVTNPWRLLLLLLLLLLASEFWRADRRAEARPLNCGAPIGALK